MYKPRSTSCLVLLVAIAALAGCEMYASIDVPDDEAEFLVGEVVTFNGTADDPEGNAIVEWDWDFGDGNSVTTAVGTVQHTYLNPGVYSVLLTVTNSIGESTECTPGYNCNVTLVANDAPCVSSSGTTCRGRITVDGMKVRYWRNYALGTANEAFRRAVIVVHGSSRNADDYFGYVIDAATTEDRVKGTLILAPNFITSDDAPEADELYWSSGGWKKGNLSQNAPDVSSFEVMDQIFEKLTEAGKFPNLEEIVLIGHSAGGQYVNRFAAGSEAEQALPGGVGARYVVANPSSYVYPNGLRRVPGHLDVFAVPDPTIDCYYTYNDYKYGLDSRNTYMSLVTADEIRAQYQTREVVYLLGENDDDPNHSSLDTSCEGMQQGDHRFERGHIYYNHLCAYYDCTNHEIVEVPGVGHSGNNMFNSPEGREVIFE